jgi:hypothetical protein
MPGCGDEKRLGDTGCYRNAFPVLANDLVVQGNTGWARLKA